MKVEYAILLAALLVSAVIIVAVQPQKEEPVKLGLQADAAAVDSSTSVGSVYYVIGTDVNETLSEAATKGYNGRRHMDMVSNGTHWLLLFNAQ